MSNKIESIQVLGSGCATCKQLFETTKKVAQESRIDVVVEYVTDVTKMIEMGVMQSPVLAVNGKPVLQGGGHSEAEIKDALENRMPESDESCGSCCSCGHRC